MKKNLIVAAFATYLDAEHTSNIDLYLRNACCCLISAKKHNLEATVALVTNINIPAPYQKILKSAEVDIWVRPFDCFYIDDGSKWTFAFYKLCALKHVINENNYDKVLLLDTDVVTMGSYQSLWKDAEAYLLLHQVVHHYDNVNEKIMQQELKHILNMEHCIHWGGEFICGRTVVLKEALAVAQQRFLQMLESGTYTTRGDEFIWTAALGDFRVKSAEAYLARCWTGKGYYFANTYMYYPGVVSLHLPDEKKRGILRLYKKIEKNRYPSNAQIFKMMRMPRNACAFSIYNVIDQIERVKRKLFR